MSEDGKTLTNVEEIDHSEVDNWRLTDRVEHEAGRGDPFAAAVRATRMPMCITDPRQPDNPIVFVNEAFQQLTGYEREEVTGRNCRFLQGPDTNEESVRNVREAIEQNRSVQETMLNYRKDGSTFWNELYLSPVASKDGEVQFFFASQVDVTERVRAEQSISQQHAAIQNEVEKQTSELTQALERQTTLLRELDHRVKNNLATISALVRLQQRAAESEECTDAMTKLRTRVDTIASVHNRLFQLDQYEGFDIGEFSAGLARDLLQVDSRSEIKLELDIETVPVAARKATPLGLALNELVTNAMKHAFDGAREPVLSIHTRADDGHAIITVADNGPGFDRSRPRSGSMGQALVERLMLEVGGETKWKSSPEGTTIILRFPTDVSGHAGDDEAG